MAISAFDLFTIGIGPSSSHTVGPMKAALLFVHALRDAGQLDRVRGLRVELFGSLGATGHGHGSVKAVILGLQGESPEGVDPRPPTRPCSGSATERRIRLLGRAPIDFDPEQDIVLHRRRRLDFHTNGMRFTVTDGAGAVLDERDYFSIGGGFVLGGDDAGGRRIVPDSTPVRYPFHTGGELVALLRRARKIDQRHHAGQRAVLAQRAGGARRAAAHLGRHAGVRAARAPAPTACCPAA